MYKWIYILRCCNNSLYTGSTSNLQRRFLQHCTGKGAKYTRAFKPLMMVACWQINEETGKALTVEAKIKKLSRQQKEHLLQHQDNIATILNLDMHIQTHPCVSIKQNK